MGRGLPHANRNHAVQPNVLAPFSFVQSVNHTQLLFLSVQFSSISASTYLKLLGPSKIYPRISRSALNAHPQIVNAVSFALLDMASRLRNSRDYSASVKEAIWSLLCPECQLGKCSARTLRSRAGDTSTIHLISLAWNTGHERSPMKTELVIKHSGQPFPPGGYIVESFVVVDLGSPFNTSTLNVEPKVCHDSYFVRP